MSSSPERSPSPEASATSPPNQGSTPPPTQAKAASPTPSSASPPPPGATSPPPSTPPSSGASSSSSPPSPLPPSASAKRPSPSSSFKAPPPPVPSQRSSKSPPSSRKSSQSASNQDHASVNVPLIAGIMAGVLLFLVLIAAVSLLYCLRKKKRRQDSTRYYAGHPGGGSLPHKGNDYYGTGLPHKWNGASPLMDHVVNLPPGAMGQPAGGGWHPAPPPSTMAISSDMSSGPHGPVLPPPPPPMSGLALGFNKSTFSYDELSAATNGFSRANLLGQGGFGYVHKGVLPSGKEIAVKSLKSGSGQGEREFQAEVDIISRVHHRHLVSLVGYCIAGGQRMLVYEFVANKTLEYHLYGSDRPTMDFPTRLKIALGAAKGLAYLHEDCHPRIIHRDIKAANILLDYNFEAMVADFGLAKLSSDTNTHVSTRVMGTFGYLAPEYASSGKLTEKSDVFSFGVMLLELITGRRPIDTSGDFMEDSLVDWGRSVLTRALGDGNYDDLVDPRLGKDYNHEEMARLVACAAASVRHSAKRRPRMSQIVRALEGDSSLEDLNEGVRPGQSTAFGSGSGTGSSDYDNPYASLKNVALASQEFCSSEYAGAGGVGAVPFSPAGSDAGASHEMHPGASGNRKQRL